MAAAVSGARLEVIERALFEQRDKLRGSSVAGELSQLGVT